MEFKKATPLRAWLANSLDLNPFFNGDARSLRTGGFCRSTMSSLRRGRRRLHLRWLLWDVYGNPRPCAAPVLGENRLGPTAACVARAPPLPRPTKQPLSVQVLSSTEYLLPNKNGGDWDNPTDTFKLSQLVAARQGLAFTWGPQEFCAKTKERTCDYNDGTIIDRTWCEAKYGPLPAPLATHVYGGGGDLVCKRGPLPSL